MRLALCRCPCVTKYVTAKIDPLEVQILEIICFSVILWTITPFFNKYETRLWKYFFCTFLVLFLTLIPRMSRNIYKLRHKLCNAKTDRLLHGQMMLDMYSVIIKSAWGLGPQKKCIQWHRRKKPSCFQVWTLVVRSGNLSQATVNRKIVQFVKTLLFNGRPASPLISWFSVKVWDNATCESL